jgi:hypothetical protein
MPEHREKYSKRYSGGGSYIQHITPQTVRYRSTGKKVPTAAAAAVCGRGTLRLRPRAYGPAGRKLDRSASREPRRPTTQMAVIGEHTANESSHQLKGMLSKLGPRLCASHQLQT